MSFKTVLMASKHIIVNRNCGCHMKWYMPFLVLTVCGISDIKTTSLWEKSCPNNCTCTVEPWPYIQLDAKVVRCENQTLSSLPRNLMSETEVLLLSLNNLGGSSDLYLHDFRYLQSMRFLDLSSNRIRTVHPHGIEFPQVRCVNLSHNNMHTLLPEILVDFPGLEWLDVEHNLIGTLPQAVLMFPHLKYLNLAQNKIYTLKPAFYFNTPQLETLILVHNYLTRLPNGIFLQTPQIKKLDLSYNRISKVEDQAFEGLRCVSDLNLEGNCLRVVPTTSLQTITSIGHLTLDHNPLRTLDSTSFKGLNITHISLCHMDELEIVHNHTFANMPYLMTLDVNTNKALTSIAPNTFKSLPNLKTLDLRNNNLFVVEENIRNDEEENRMTLDEHKYKEPDEKSFDKTAAGPKSFHHLTLHLTGNPLICDCNLKWVQDIVLRQYNQNITIPDGHKVKCLDSSLDKAIGLMDLDELPKQCPPFVLPLFPSVVKEMASSDVSFYCRGVGNPPPKIHWILPDGRIMANDSCEYRTCVHGNTLSIKMIHMQDTGLYECQAINLLGTFKRTLHLEVDSTNVLLLPLTISATFITMIWNASGLPSTRFILKYSPTRISDSSGDELKIIDVSSKAYSYTVGGLSPGETYTFSLCIQRSDYSITISSLNVTTREQGFLFRWGIRSNYITIIMIGAATTVIFIGCASMCCLKLCQWARREHSEMVASDMDSGRYFVKSDSCDSQVAFMTSYINVTDDSILIDNEDESIQ